MKKCSAGCACFSFRCPVFGFQWWVPLLEHLPKRSVESSCPTLRHETGEPSRQKDKRLFSKSGLRSRAPDLAEQMGMERRRKEPGSLRGCPEDGAEGTAFRLATAQVRGSWNPRNTAYPKLAAERGSRAAGQSRTSRSCSGQYLCQSPLGRHECRYSTSQGPGEVKYAVSPELSSVSSPLPPTIPSSSSSSSEVTSLVVSSSRAMLQPTWPSPMSGAS